MSIATSSLKTLKWIGFTGAVLFLLLLKLNFKTRGPDSFSPQILAAAEEGEGRGVPLDIEVDLQQPFHYLGHGTQAVAFASQDGQYVLKFFLKKGMNGKKSYRIPSLLDLIPSHRRSKEKRREERHERSLRAAIRRYKIAFEELKEETGLLALHFQKTAGYPRCVVADRYGKEAQIDLDKTSFAVQKRAVMMAEKFSKRQTEKEKLDALAAMEELLERRARKGFKDCKGGFIFEANYGFLGDQAILLDPGRIEFSEAVFQNPEPEIAKMKKRLNLRFPRA